MSNYVQRKIYTSQDTTPRQRRLEAERRFLISRYHETFSAIAGGILLVVIILCLAFI
jgi:uncharacterized integral membrane protein